MSNIAIASQGGDRFIDQPELTPQEIADGKAPDEAEALYFDWNMWALDKQRPPEGDWTTWLLLGGRGSGKSHFVGGYVVERHLDRGQATVCIREVQKTLKDSAKRLIEGKLVDFNLGEADGWGKHG